MFTARCNRNTRSFVFALILVAAALGATPLLADAAYIVELTGAPAAVAAASAAAAGGPLSGDEIQAVRDELRRQQDILLARLRKEGVGFIVDKALIGDFLNGAATPIELRYTLVYNGIALRLAAADVARVAATPGVKAVHENPVRRPNLDQSVAYIRAPQVYGAHAELEPGDDDNDGFEGQGTNVAVIDTGIEWSHPMFGGDPTPPRHGLLPPTAAVGSNPKVVYYLPLMENVIDDFGHGTHVAATAAGYRGFAPGADGVPGTIDDVPIHGVAPQARLMGYKVCSGIGSASGTVGCLGTSIILAIEDAVSPRTLTGFAKPVADVINLSLGSAGGPDDSDSVAASNAALLGTIVVAAAGNDGPGLRTLGSPAAGRHVIAVGASNDPGVYANPLDVLLQPGAPRMAAIWAPDSNLRQNITAPIVGRYVYGGWADTPDQVPATVLGNICLVERGSTATAGDQGTGLFTVKVLNCEAKGAIATVVFNDVPGALEGVLAPGSKPVFTLSQADGRYLRDTVGFDLTGLSKKAVRIGPPEGSMFLPQMGGFSSRGPVRGLGQVKPDVAAPGVDVLAATTPVGVPVLSMADPTRYTSTNGTSMASPHVAGVAALLRQAHPTWSVDMVRTALINYATNLRNAAGTAKADGAAADPILAQGGGLVDVAAAVNAKALLGVVGDGVDAPALLGSHSFGRLPVVNTRVAHSERVTVQLFDTSGEGGTYTFAAADNRALAVPGVSVTVAPASVTLAPGGDAEILVTVTIDGNALRTVPEDDLQWYVTATRGDGAARLRMPFFLQPIPSQPASASGERNETFEGIVPAGDTGAQVAVEVTYVDVPFAVGVDAYGIEADLTTTVPTVEGTYPDLDFVLFDPNGEELASSLSAGVPEHIDALTIGAGTYTYRVVGWLNGPTPFTISSKQLLGSQPPNLLPAAGEWTAATGEQVDFDGSFVLDWQPAGPATGYEIERSIDRGASWDFIASAPAGTTSWSLTGQPAGEMRYRMRALSPGRIGLFVSAPSNAQTIFVDPRSEEDVTKWVTRQTAGVSFSNGVYQLDLGLKNTATNAYLPAVHFDVIAIHSTSGAVYALNPDSGGNGTRPDLAARWEYGNKLGADERWSGGETTGARALRFADPLGEMFTFDVVVLANRRIGEGGGTGEVPVGGAPSGGGSGSGGGSQPQGSRQMLRFTVNPLTGSVTTVLLPRP